jgi:hypothetical protein
MPLFKDKSLTAFALCSIILSIATFWGGSDGHSLPRAAMGWDVSGYYLYLPSIFYDDLGKVHKRQYIIDTYHPCGNNLEVYPCPNGNYIMKYSSGMAIMYMPGFLAGHFVTQYTHYPRDGFSYPYGVCMAFYSLLIALIGLWFMRKVLLIYFSDTITAIALVALCAGTNYLNYSAMVSMLTHNYLFTVYAIVIYLTIRWYLTPDYKKSIALGVLCGLAALTRPTEIIIALIPMLWGLYSFESVKERLKIFKQHISKLLLFSFCAIAVGSIQLIYWKVYTGHFLYWSYPDDQGFNFLRVPVWHCLFSYKKGWFTYTPLMILSIIGLVPLYLKHRNIFVPIVFFCFLCLYITFAWKIWWYGGSFSMRAVVQYYTVFLFPFCAFLEISALTIWAGLLTGLCMVFCIWLNLVMTYQANFSHIMECDNMSEAYYWKIFGKLDINPVERRLVDCPEELPEKLIPKLKEIFVSDFASDTDTAGYAFVDGEKVQFAGPERNFTRGASVKLPEGGNGWYRVKSKVFLTDYTWDIFSDPVFTVTLCDKEGHFLKRNFYHIQRVMKPRNWTDLPIDIYLKPHEQVTELRTGFSDYSNTAKIYVKDIRVYYSTGDK